MVSKRQELSPTKRNVSPTQVKKETGTKIENNRNVQFEWSGFLRNDPRLPSFSNRSPNMEELFKICLLSKILSERLVKIKLTRVQEAATFAVRQDLINQEHPYDIEADDTSRAFVIWSRPGTLLASTNYRWRRCSLVLRSSGSHK